MTIKIYSKPKVSYDFYPPMNGFKLGSLRFKNADELMCSIEVSEKLEDDEGLIIKPLKTELRLPLKWFELGRHSEYVVVDNKLKLGDNQRQTIIPRLVTIRYIFSKEYLNHSHNLFVNLSLMVE